MAIYELPVSDDPNKIYRFTLGDKDYDLHIRYLQRLTNVANGQNIKADEWVLRIGPTGKTPDIETSLKTNRNLLEMHRYKDSCPLGLLELRDELADAERSIDDGYNYSPERVTKEGLGGRWKLMYVD